MRVQAVLTLGVLCVGCGASSDATPKPTTVRLAWYANVATEAWPDARSGLLWALSNLGAAPTDAEGIAERAIVDGAVAFDLDLTRVGFPAERLADVEAAVAPLRADPTQPVDVGRFLMATLYDPARYYAITGACGSLDAWVAARLPEEPLRYAVTVSQLVEGERLIAFAPAPAEAPDTGAGADAAAGVERLAWLAAEGEGSLVDGSFVPTEYETVDVLPNGQQRFAVYGPDGRIRAAAADSPAGQPGKCMWCHEMWPQRGTAENPGVPGYLDHAAFVAEVARAEPWMAAARDALGGADFGDYLQHERAEWLTLGFLEPSPARVAREWGVAEAEVRGEGLATHVNAEYPELGELYTRADVDAARWLGEAVCSALAECGPDDEVLVVDDGSRDDPAAVLPTDRRLRIVHQPPLGIVPAMERGRRLLDTPLIARLDADDVALPGRIAAQRALLDADPGLAAVGGRAAMRADDGEVPEGMRRYTEWVNSVADPNVGLLVESPLFHPAVLMRAAAVEAVGGYRDGDFPEDYDLWLRFVEAGWRLGTVPSEVVLLRDRPGRLTRTDPRYARRAFFPLKRDWVARMLLPEPRRVLVWGAGQEGTPWIRWLRQAGHEVPAALDIKHGTTRQGVPVLAPEALASLRFDLLLVAVGARGARDEIRGRIQAMRPELVEGRDWWAVA